MMLDEMTFPVPELAIVDAIVITPEDMPPDLTKFDHVFGSLDGTGALTTGSGKKSKVRFEIYKNV